MRIVVALVTILALTPSLPGDAGARTSRKECRQACTAAVEACVAAGGTRKRCKRQTLRQCRKAGVAVCVATTTTSPVTTTTLPPGPTGPRCETSGAPACGGRCSRRSEVCRNQGGTCACVGIRL